MSFLDNAVKVAKVVAKGVVKVGAKAVHDTAMQHPDEMKMKFSEMGDSELLNTWLRETWNFKGSKVTRWLEDEIGQRDSLKRNLSAIRNSQHMDVEKLEEALRSTNDQNMRHVYGSQIKHLNGSL